MSRIKRGIEKDEWNGKSPFEQFQLATHGRKIYNSKVSDFVFFLDHITYMEKTGRVIGDEKIAWDWHKKEIAENLMDLWWEAKNSKNGDAFRQMTWMAEDTVAKSPDWQFVTWMKVEFVNHGKPALPVAKLVKLYNDIWRQHEITGLPETNYRQIDRICKKLKYPAPKEKRGPKPGLRRKPARRNS